MHVLLGSIEEKSISRLLTSSVLAHAKTIACGVLLAKVYSVRSTLLLKITLTVRLILRSLWLMQCSHLIKGPPHLRVFLPNHKFLLQSYIRHFVNLILTYQPASQLESLFFLDSAFRNIRKRLITIVLVEFFELPGRLDCSILSSWIAVPFWLVALQK